MELPGWVGEAFTPSLTLSYWRRLGLAFLLGSFAVATWSDLERLSAQPSFSWRYWRAFLAAMLAIDVYDAHVREAVAGRSWPSSGCSSPCSRSSPWRRLPLLAGCSASASADAAALAAAAGLLTPLLVVVFYLGAKLLRELIGPLLGAARITPSCRS